MGSPREAGFWFTSLSLGRQRGPPQYRSAMGIQRCWLCAQPGARGHPRGLWIDVREEK